MKNLLIEDKIFWKNFFYALAVFIIVWLVLGYMFNNPEDDIPRTGGFFIAYVSLSSFYVLYFCYTVGIKFIRNEEIDEKIDILIKKEKLSIQEFKEKYKEIVSIYEVSISPHEYIEELKNNGNCYEFINNAGGKEVVTVGYDDTKKCDIYWEDIVASKNNNFGTDIGGFDPTEVNNIVNKKCPVCGGTVDRFYFQSNEKREVEYTGWMEACLKCKKPIYFEVEVMD